MAERMRITRAGQLGGKGRRVAVTLRATEEQVRLGWDTPRDKDDKPIKDADGNDIHTGEFDVEVSPRTGAMQQAAREMFPDAVPPMVDGVANVHDPGFLSLLNRQRAGQRVVLAAMALGMAYFGTDDIEAAIKIMLGPPEAGGFIVEQVDRIAVAAASASALTRKRAEEVKDSLTPTGSTAKADPVTGESTEG